MTAEQSAAAVRRAAQSAATLRLVTRET